jgi:hypothetical protein
MTEPTRKNRRRALQTAGHYVTGFVILIDGFELLENGAKHRSFGLAFCLAGLVFIAVTALHAKLEARFRHAQTVLYFVESLVLAGIAFLYAIDGKVGLPYAYGAAALLLAGLCVWELVRAKR